MKKISVYFHEDDPADMMIYNHLESIGRKKRGILIKALAGNMIAGYGYLFNTKFANALIEIANSSEPVKNIGSTGIKNTSPATSSKKKKSPRVIKKEVKQTEQVQDFEPVPEVQEEEKAEEREEKTSATSSRPNYRLKDLKEKAEPEKAAEVSKNQDPNTAWLGDLFDPSDID